MCGDVKLPVRSQAMFSLKAVAVVMIALWIGYSLNLDRPTSEIRPCDLVLALPDAIHFVAPWRTANWALEEMKEEHDT